MEDMVAKRAAKIIEEGRSSGRPSYEAAQEIAREEEKVRWEVLEEVHEADERWRVLQSKYPDRLPDRRPMDFTQDYPTLFPAEVFNPDGSRKPGNQQTRMEARVAFEWGDSQGL